MILPRASTHLNPTLLWLQTGVDGSYCHRVRYDSCNLDTHETYISRYLRRRTVQNAPPFRRSHTKKNQLKVQHFPVRVPCSCTRSNRLNAVECTLAQNSHLLIRCQRGRRTTNKHSDNSANSDRRDNTMRDRQLIGAIHTSIAPVHPGALRLVDGPCHVTRRTRRNRVAHLGHYRRPRLIHSPTTIMASPHNTAFQRITSAIRLLPFTKLPSCQQCV